MKFYTLLLAWLFVSHLSMAQFSAVYPIGDSPTISWRSGMTNKETILFEAQPIVRYSFHNRIKESLDNPEIQNASAYYLSFRPQLRMYTDNSVPVKMPSYRVFLGYQYFKKLSENNQLAISFETGHYSNGQSGCTYDTLFADASDACNAVYETILNSGADLSEHLNRSNGEFSTDLTELIVNYRINNIGLDNKPKDIHSFQAGFTYYHKYFFGILPFGGFSDNDIKIYGRLRTKASYEYIFPLNWEHKGWLGKYLNRISLKQTFEYIHGGHKQVKSIRSETTASIFLRNNFGFFVSFVHGHDNYNIRFLDSGNEFAAGFTWSIFPLSEILKPSN